MPKVDELTLRDDGVRKMNIWVSHAEVRAAWEAWYGQSGLTLNAGMSRFRKITGVDSFIVSHQEVTEEQARRIKLLATPNSYALSKAMIVQDEQAFANRRRRRKLTRKQREGWEQDG